jgi:hypothetical protein
MYQNCFWKVGLTLCDKRPYEEYHNPTILNNPPYKGQDNKKMNKKVCEEPGWPVAERQLGTSVEVGNLVLAAQSDAELNRIPKRCPVAMSHQDYGPACEGERRGCYPGSSCGVGHHGANS